MVSMILVEFTAIDTGDVVWEFNTIVLKITSSTEVDIFLKKIIAYLHIELMTVLFRYQWQKL
jgi:hypothetical protein